MPGLTPLTDAPQPGPMVSHAARVLGYLLVACLAGCQPPSEAEVVVYAALDAEFSRPILDRFQKQTGIRVLAKFDIEANKSVGLATSIIEEVDRPRCDVFWNNEIIHTLRLARSGLLDAYVPAQADQFPAMYRSSDGFWHGFAGRARVLLVNVDLVTADEMPHSIHDLALERWRGRTGIARPLFGTTATHAACLFSSLGEQPAKAYFMSLLENGVQVLPGNKQVAQAVSSGQLAFGLTDTDDAVIEIEQGFPVRIVYPDQEDLGTLFIPNTLAIIRGGPNPEQARQLADYLLSPRIESLLADGPSAQIPLNQAAHSAAENLRVETPRSVRAMQVDFEQAADQWESAVQFIRDKFLAP